MIVCYFGNYDREHPRNIVILNALKHEGVDVVECHSRHRIKLLRFALLFVRFLRNCRSTDLIYVAAIGHYYVVLAWALARLTGKHLVFDPLISMYDTLVHDRQIVPEDSVKARLLWLLDKFGCILADQVILDTGQHVDYFVETFNLPGEKFCVVPVGADQSLFRPGVPAPDSPSDGDVQVLYVGNFIPLHGVLRIIEAARLLRHEPYCFRLVGDGPDYGAAKQLVRKLSLKNVEFLGRLSREAYANALSDADIALGVFGSSDKALRVVPCKVYDAIAMGKPVVTAATSAIQQYFNDGENIKLCAPHDLASLAEAIRYLGTHADERFRIGEHGRLLFEKQFSTPAIGRELAHCLGGLQARCS